MIKSSRRNTVENFELLPAFVAGAGVLTSGTVDVRQIILQKIFCNTSKAAPFDVLVRLHQLFTSCVKAIIL
jgi:hypothetical protein